MACPGRQVLFTPVSVRYLSGWFEAWEHTISGRDKQRLARARAVKAAEAARARRQRRTRIALGTALLAIAAGFVTLTMTLDGQDKTKNDTAEQPGLLTTAPPWPPQTEGLSVRLAALDFPPVGDESYHAHILLSVFRDGTPVEVPANIGFGPDGSHSSLHTHTPDGVIHMEADDPFPYELGQLFQVWGVAFGPDRLGGDVAAGDKKVFVYVNGKLAPPGPVAMKDKDNVVVAYGTADSFPKLPDDAALNRA